MLIDKSTGDLSKNRFNAEEYLYACGNYTISKHRRQAAAALPLWLSALQNGECVATRAAVDTGLPFKQHLTAELGVAQWTWKRLRVLKPELIFCKDADKASLSLIAKIIEAMGPDTPHVSEHVLLELCSICEGLKYIPPARMSLAFARGIGLQARRQGWAKILPNLRGPTARPRGPIEPHRIWPVIGPMIGHALNDLLLCANAERVQNMCESETRRFIPIAIRNLYAGASFSKIREYCGQWADDMRFGGVSHCCPDTTIAPFLVPDFSDPVRQVTVRQLITRDELAHEGDLMNNCVATLWPQVSNYRGVIFSLTTANAFVRASVLFSIDGRGQWQSICAGPGNTRPEERLRLVTSELRSTLQKSVSMQGGDVANKFLMAAQKIARYSPGGSLYSNVLTATAAELMLMRRWFPCANRDPVSRLRDAWPNK